MAASPQDTRDRLLVAASKLFAERGYHGTKMREIAERAEVNLASGNYHFGSKRELYLAVLRSQFAEIRAGLEKRGGTKPPAELDRLGREDLVDLLQRRIQAILELLIGPPPSLHGTLMQWEMLDPTEAFPVIVQELIQPMRIQTEQIVSHLAPELSSAEVERCALSIVGQTLFYRFAMPAILRMMGQKDYPRGTSRRLAEHIGEFSLGGMATLAKGKRRRHAS